MNVSSSNASANSCHVRGIYIRVYAHPFRIFTAAVNLAFADFIDGRQWRIYIDAHFAWPYPALLPFSSSLPHGFLTA